MIPRKIITCITLVLFASGVQSQILWNTDNLQAVKDSGEYSSVKSSCIKKADSSLKQAAVSVVADTKKWVEDTHNYASLSVYYWPDPDDSTAPYIRKDGERNPEADDYDANKFSTLQNRLKWLSIGYWLTSDNKYAEAYTEQLKTWFLDKDTYMYPNFEYAQIMPGHNKNKGTCYGLIEAYRFIDVLESIRLMETAGGLDKATAEGVREWFREFVRWMQTSDLGVQESKTKNNHAIAYDVMLLLMSELTSDNDVVKRITASFRSSRLDTQISADGSQPQELARTKALHYSIYNLTHIIDFCIIRESRGDHYYEANREIINSAFAYLWQFVGNKEAFPYKEIGDWDSLEDNLRAQTRRIRRLRGADLSFVPTGEKMDTDISVGSMLN